jgi:ribosome maturation factor RimP
LLDVKDVIDGKYTLEVSTPGVNRKLATAEHFKSFQGKRVRVKCFHPIEGRRVFLGILQAAEEERIQIRDDAGVDWTIPISDIAKANYEHVFPW